MRSNIDISFIKEMTSQEFHRLCNKLLSAMGYELLSSRVCGNEMELIATARRGWIGKVLIRAKKSSRPVEVAEIIFMGERLKREVEQTKCVFISSSGFDMNASREGEERGFLLIDSENLVQLCKEHGIPPFGNERKKGSFLPSVDVLEDYMRTGNEFYAKKDYERAILWFEKAISLKGNYDLGWYMKGQALAKMGRVEEAVRAYKQALSSNPNNPEVWFALGVALYHMKRFEEELSCYDQAIKLNRNFEKAWANKGATLHQLGRFQEAIKCYDAIIALNPYNEVVWNNMGAALSRLGRKKEALTCFEKALELKKDYTDAWLNKGLNLYEREDYKEAIMCFDELLKGRKNLNALYYKGRSLMKLEGFADAIECFDRILSVEPNFEDVLELRKKAEERKSHILK